MSAPKQQKPVKRTEYEVGVSRGFEGLKDDLNRLAAEGWRIEAFSVLPAIDTRIGWVVSREVSS